MFENIQDVIKDLLGFLKESKKFFLLPLIITLLLVGILTVFVQTSVLAPFIYTLF